MNRRGFLQSLLGLAASPAVAKIAPLLPGVAAVNTISRIKLREMVRRQLAEWFARQMDEAMFRQLTDAR